MIGLKMKKFMRNKLFFFIVGLLMISILLISFQINQNQQPKPWDVPTEFKNKVNPVKVTEQNLAEGKVIYEKNCASCHGKKGLGDGPKARQLETSSGDFTGNIFQVQTDGEHFYKTKEGRGEMPAYKGKLSDEDIWTMVNYMRTFKK